MKRVLIKKPPKQKRLTPGNQSYLITGAIYGNILWIVLFPVFLLPTYTLGVQSLQPPVHLRTDLLEHTDKVFIDGYSSTMKLEERGDAIERYQVARIKNIKPCYSWQIYDSTPNTLQKGYQILVATDLEKLTNETPDVWDSGYVESDNSVSVQHGGVPLKENNIYYWKVRIWDNQGRSSSYSSVKNFLTANLLDGTTARYPLQKHDDHPATIQPISNSSVYIDFGKASFGRLRLTLYSENGGDTVLIHLGEHAKGNRIVRDIGISAIRYAKYELALLPGSNTYLIKIRPDERNTTTKGVGESGVTPVLMPPYTGEILPFRYCELEHYSYPLKEKDVVRETVHYPFDENSSSFQSSDTVLNALWDISKYAIKATSYTGIYVDGDRERIPYENEALTNQLCHYVVDGEYSIARYSHEYLITNPTWPTEWHLKSVQMAWYDYLYTGNKMSLEAFYEDLKAKTLLALTEENGLISTRTGKQTVDFWKSIHFRGDKLKDIVDWPHTGILGLDEKEFGETDGFVFTDYNTVVNALHYDALHKMGLIARALGDREAYRFFKDKAGNVKRTINELLFDEKNKRYVDGLGTDHSSLHANIYPLAFGIVPRKNKQGVLTHIKERGMACNLSAPTLVESVYQANDANYGLHLLTKTDERSWYNAIRIGSTITIEAWDNKYKPNLDWNHAEGAAPAYLIAKYLMGIQPIEPGYRKILIKPQPSRLECAKIKVPTIRGDVNVEFNNNLSQFEMQVDIPPNAVAEIQLPALFQKYKLFKNGVAVRKPIIEDDFIKIDEIGSGVHQFLLKKD